MSPHKNRTAGRRGPARGRIAAVAAIAVVGTVAAGLSTPGTARAQEAAEPTPPAAPRARDLASPYLPLEHWANPALELWVARGEIQSLSPFVKPWRRIEAAAGLLELDRSRLGGGERAWLERLEAELAPELARLAGAQAAEAQLTLRASAGAGAWSQTHRDPLRAELDGEFSDARVLESVGAEVEGHGGPVAGAFRLWREGIYRYDAQFPDGQVTPPREAFVLDDVSARFEEAYIELQSPFVRLSFGRMYRNWGPPGLPGFLRSDYAYSEEEIGYRVGTGRIFLIGSLASYSDFGGDTNRYVAVHRLEVRPFDDLIVAISESSVHGGPGQGLDWRLVNPLTIWQFSGDEEDTPYNKIGQVDAWWHAGRGLNLFGSLLADATNRDGSCCQMGGSLGFEIPSLLSGWMLRGTFSAIQSLAYRTELPWEEYSVERIGLGWDKADLYLVRLEASVLPLAGLWLAPRLEVQVRGEGDFRELRPPGDELADYPRILVGQSETTVRPSIAGRWRSGGRFPVEIDWDLGLNLVRDHGNVAGEDRTEPVGRIEARIATPRGLLSAP